MILQKINYYKRDLGDNVQSSFSNISLYIFIYLWLNTRIILRFFLLN